MVNAEGFRSSFSINQGFQIQTENKMLLMFFFKYIVEAIFVFKLQNVIMSKKNIKNHLNKLLSIKNIYILEV